VPADRFHLTVLFMGQVDDAAAAAIRHSLERPFEEAPFDLEIEGVGAFPASGPPRVIWIGVGAGRDAFVRVQRAAYERTAAVLPLEPEREARPHLTLARVKEAGGLRARSLVAGLEPRSLGRQRVAGVTLFHSRPVRGGVEYAQLLTIPLEAGTAGKAGRAGKGAPFPSA
jgi:2'-5' RNA ligase